MRSQLGRWILGLLYIFSVAAIWIAASFVVQSVVDEGVSPFLITYICNSLFVVLIPVVEIGRFLEDKYGSILFWQKSKEEILPVLRDSDREILLEKEHVNAQIDSLSSDAIEGSDENDNIGLDSKRRWTRTRVAKISLLICPFWFFAQLTFNLSLKFTTVTSNTILSSASSLFTFLVSLVFLREKFTWIKLFGVLLCMLGAIIVGLGDSQTRGLSTYASNPVLGDSLSLVSAALYAVYITLIRKHLPDDDDEKRGRVSMAQFLGFLGLFNFLIFLPVALLLDFAKLEPFSMLTWEQFFLIIGKGLLDNVLSDYLWAKAVILTTTTVATAGLTIQVPLAAIVDILTGNAPPPLDYIGAASVLVGFVGINIPSDACSRSSEDFNLQLDNENVNSAEEDPSSSR